MSFDMTAIGLTLVTLFAGVLGVIGYGVWRLLGRQPWLVWVIGSVVVCVVSVPLIEEAVIATRFERLCRDAGVHVVKTATASSFYDETGLVGPDNLSEGWTFLEYLDLASDTPYRVELSDGSTRTTTIDRPMSRYHYKHAYQPTRFETAEPVARKVLKSETIVLDSTNGESLGRDTRFVRSPSVADAIWIRFLGHGRIGCSGPLGDSVRQRRPSLLYKYVLIPKKTD